MNTKLVIFDLDGTLFRTETVDLVAMNKALLNNGLKAKSDKEIIDSIGVTLSEFCEILLGEDTERLKTKFFADVIQFELEEIEKCGELYTGAKEMLENLTEEGYTLCICSNGSKDYIHAIIKKFGLNKYFKEIWTQTEGITKPEAVGILKAKFNVDSFIMVGDRIYDIEAAKANQGISIGVSYGYGKDEVYQADHTCHSILELEDRIYKISEKEG